MYRISFEVCNASVCYMWVKWIMKNIKDRGALGLLYYKTILLLWKLCSKTLNFIIANVYGKLHLKH